MSTASVSAPTIVVRALSSRAAFTRALSEHRLSRRKRVVVAGSRTWGFPSVIRDSLQTLNEVPRGAVILSAQTPGAGRAASNEARKLGHPVFEFPAPGGPDRRDGPRTFARNSLLLACAQPSTTVVIFAADLKASPSLRDLANKAYRLGLDIITVDAGMSTLKYALSGPATITRDDLLAEAAEVYPEPVA